MPFSANSPEGPVSLLRVDPMTVEQMRARNRKEKVFTAKCCGAPLSIRVSRGKAPHFVHQVSPQSCDSDRSETPEHRRLKALVAQSAMRSCVWDIETEAIERDASSGQIAWRADVLAMRGRARVAFEVQLSNADFENMRARQERYRRSKVRGLWLVRTKKGFPQCEELPVFTVSSGRDGDWVYLSTRWDAQPDIWARSDGGDSVELGEFIEAALDGRLNWAPYLKAPDTLLNADIFYQPIGDCAGCKRTLAASHSAMACIASEWGYPDFIWHQGLVPQRKTNWHQMILNLVWAQVAKDVDISFVSADAKCSWCSSKVSHRSARGSKGGTLSGRLRLGDLPRPMMGTVEWNWLRRWFVREP